MSVPKTGVGLRSESDSESRNSIEQEVNNQYWKATKARAELPPDTRLRALRRTAATTLTSKNVNPRLVADLLGHSNIKITFTTYSHTLPHMGSIAADAMDSFLQEERA
jgi:integrase